MNELREFRESFGGADRRAINRHSVRVYVFGGRRYTLDRNLSAVPHYFTLYRHDPRHLIQPEVKVNGLRCWGDGLSWPKAVALAAEAVQVEGGAA